MLLAAEGPTLDLLDLAAKIGQLGAPTLLVVATITLWKRREEESAARRDAEKAHAAEIKAQRDACDAELRRERDAGAVKLQAAQDKLDTFQERERAETKALLADMMTGGK